MSRPSASQPPPGRETVLGADALLDLGEVDFQTLEERRHLGLGRQRALRRHRDPRDRLDQQRRRELAERRDLRQRPGAAVVARQIEVDSEPGGSTSPMHISSITRGRTGTDNDLAWLASCANARRRVSSDTSRCSSRRRRAASSRARASLAFLASAFPLVDF